MDAATIRATAASLEAAQGDEDAVSCETGRKLHAEAARAWLDLSEAWTCTDEPRAAEAAGIAALHAKAMSLCAEHLPGEEYAEAASAAYQAVADWA